jgi:hypothetical protein
MYKEQGEGNLGLHIRMQHRCYRAKRPQGKKNKDHQYCNIMLGLEGIENFTVS